MSDETPYERSLRPKYPIPVEDWKLVTWFIHFYAGQGKVWCPVMSAFVAYFVGDMKGTKFCRSCSMRLR